MFSDVTKHSKQRKTTKLIKLQWIASIWCPNDKNNSKLQTRSNYDQFASIWRQNDQKHWCTVAKHSEQRKTTKLIKLQWISSIWHQNNQKCWDTSQNIQNNAKLQNWSNYNELLLFDVRTIKTTKTTNAIKLRSICIVLTSKQSKMLRYVAKHSKQRKPTKVIKL